LELEPLTYSSIAV